MKKLIIIASLALFVVLVSSSMALAYHVIDVDPHQRFGFEPATGFSSDFCLQCHDIHAAAGDYALMARSTVTNTCGTCHGVYQAAPTGAIDPGYLPGQTSGMAALKSVYKVPLADQYLHEGHRLGQGGSATSSTISYASGPDGSVEVTPYTTSSPDFIPGSGYPGVASYKYLTRINNWSSFVAGADMSAFLASGRQATKGLYCANCHSPHGTIRGSALPGGVTKNKLLSSRPNHAQTAIDASAWTSWTANGYNFCLSCHAQRAEGGTPDGLTPHNHPASFCIECHGNNPAGAVDFPHTGVKNLLAEYPDQLCVASCHAFGLP